MKKLVIGFAILGSIAFLGATGRALAADPAAGGDDKAAGGAAAAGGGDEANTTYKAKTVYDFEDDTVEGDLQRPDGELVSAQKKAEHSSLIEIRKDFIPEMLKTLEDI
jgi:hypothetical protein